MDCILTEMVTSLRKVVKNSLRKKQVMPVAIYGQTHQQILPIPRAWLLQVNRQAMPCVQTTSVVLKQKQQENEELRM